MAGLGVSFLPGAQDDNGQHGENGRTGASRTPVQQAIKILSLRLPKFYGAGAIAPAPLLTAAGGMGQPAARGNVSAQALAGLAGLPPSMAMPAQAAPTLGGGGTDTMGGWADQERRLNGRPTIGSVPSAPSMPSLPSPPPRSPGNPSITPQTPDGGPPPDLGGNWQGPLPTLPERPAAPTTADLGPPAGTPMPFQAPSHETALERLLRQYGGSIGPARGNW